MAIMTRMRENMPTILFGLLIAFLITIVFEWGMDYLGLSSGRVPPLGSVNGKEISSTQFEEAVKGFVENQRQQTGRDPDDAQMTAIRDQVWRQMVNDVLIEQEIERLGLTVTDSEIQEWVFGDNPPEFLRRSFTDSTGRFDREMYRQVLSNPDQAIQDPDPSDGVDPRFGSKQLVLIEQQLRQQRLREKLQSLILSSARVGEGELRERYAERNQSFEAVYVLFDGARLVADTAVQVTDADLRAAYDAGLDLYKEDASRTLRFVHFRLAPSAADSANALRDIQDAAAKARGGMDFLQVSAMYGERPDSGVMFRHGELSPALEAAVFAAKAGDVVGPVEDAGSHVLMKVLEEQTGAGEYVRASHILFALDGTKDSTTVKSRVQEVARQARGGADFATLARANSADPGSAQNGGDLGWFGRGRMVKEFEEAAFRGRVGEVVGPVRTSYGFHIIKVTARDNRSLKVATVRIAVAPSAQTRNDLVERARDFAYNARASEFAKEAQASGFEVREGTVQEKGGFIPGLGVNESITRWAFKSGVGDVSEPFSVDAGWAVFVVTGAREKGVRPFDDVRELLRPEAVRRKRIEAAKAAAAEAKSKMGEGRDLMQITQVDPTLVPTRVGPFTMAGTAGALGRDLKFMGAVAAAEPGKVVGPVEAYQGAYLIEVVSRTPVDSSAFAAARPVMEQQLLQEKRSRLLSDWITRLNESADIEDNRDLWYR